MTDIYPSQDVKWYPFEFSSLTFVYTASVIIKIVHEKFTETREVTSCRRKLPFNKEKPLVGLWTEEVKGWEGREEKNAAICDQTTYFSCWLYWWSNLGQRSWRGPFIDTSSESFCLPSPFRMNSNNVTSMILSCMTEHKSILNHISSAHSSVA